MGIAYKGTSAFLLSLLFPFTLFSSFPSHMVLEQPRSFLFLLSSLVLIMEETTSSVAHTSPTSDPPSLPTSFNISHHCHTPMDRTSYLCWMNQFQTVLNIHDLSSIISNRPPPSSLGGGKANPTYTYWKKTDQLVLSWIKATVTTSVQTILLRCNKASKAWQLLE